MQTHGSNLDGRLYKNNSFASALGGACAMNEHHGIDPNMSNSVHSSNRFSCSIKFFHLIIALGLPLGESWPLLAVYKGLFPREGLLRHTCKNHLRREKGCKFMDQI